MVLMLLTASLAPEKADLRVVPFCLCLVFELLGFIFGINGCSTPRPVREVFTQDVHVQIRRPVWDVQALRRANLLAVIFLVLGVVCMVFFLL